MSTNRRPVARPLAPRLTPEALDAFRELRQLGCTCHGAGQCSGCQRRNELERVIHRALGLKPWDVTCEPPDAPCPWPAGTGGARSWPAAQARWKTLAAALRQKQQ